MILSKTDTVVKQCFVCAVISLDGSSQAISVYSESPIISEEIRYLTMKSTA